MKIQLCSELYNNSIILTALNENFGGVTQDTPDFIEAVTSENNEALVCSDDASYDDAAYVASVTRFLEEHFYSDLKKLRN